MAGKASDFIPALKYGNKIHPEDLAGMVGLPHVGNVYYVDPTNGSDTANAGKQWNDAFASVGQFESTATDNNYDVCILAPGLHAASDETSAITWEKDHLSLVGNVAPVGISQRARVLANTSVSPMITVSGYGNNFKNVQLASWNDNNILMTVTGSRNYFSNVHFAGIGNATTGDDTAARVLYMNGAQECRFDDCVFGVDTVMRSTTNATVEFASSASRNRFFECEFIMAADNVGPNHILLTGSSAIDRWLRFHNCSWYSFWTNDSDKVTHVIDAAAQTATGHIRMTGSNDMVGFDDWEAANSSKVWFQGYTNTSNVVGIAINPSVS
ncbi:hypothetical protein CL633_04540 [bacterium]|jgi:hypothetical protein|nr:hypothetical protein [bacterium]|tara:strand:+ start:5186 stop:6163 length:978 start_codon:yes stop_codon:yes gene_type:complete